MSDLGKLLIVLGAALLVTGIVLVVVARANLPLGRLPGDIVYRGKNTTFYFPLATSLLVSVCSRWCCTWWDGGGGKLFPKPGLTLFFFRPFRGLIFSEVLTHGLRPGLYSCAAWRLQAAAVDS